MSDQFILVRADPDQAAAIRDLTLRAYAKWVPITPRKPRPMTTDYDVAVQQHRFDCVTHGEVLVGLIETVRKDGELMIMNVAVDPAWQGNGLGVRLMRHAEDLARVARLRGTRLYTNKLMTENIAFYEALGYSIEKETHHEQGTVAVHMTRSVE